jgi:hypothetical protein
MNTVTLGFSVLSKGCLSVLFVAKDLVLMKQHYATVDPKVTLF